MDEYLFPKATQEVLSIIHKPDDDRQIDEYLQRFGLRCVKAFFASLIPTPVLFTDEELLERMKEQRQ